MAAPKSAVRKPRKKDKKNIAAGHAHIKSTFNNTIVSITDTTGAVISQASNNRDELSPGLGILTKSWLVEHQHVGR